MAESQAEKRPVTRIPSDDCVVEGRHPHRGEWVEITGKMSVAEMRASWNASAEAMKVESLKDDALTLQREIKALQAEDADAEKLERAVRRLERTQSERTKLVDESFGVIAKAVARRVVAWSWTDDRGRPLVPWNATDPETGESYALLDGAAETIELVELDELLYLRNLLTGEAPADRKNGSGGSQPTSSATSSPEMTKTPSSTSARKPTRG